MNKLHAHFVVPALIALVALAPARSAAEPSSQDPFSAARPKPPDGGLVTDCFKYYRFGSVTLDLVPASPEVASGTEFEVRGHIINHNSYPIVDARVYVKVFRDRPEGADQDGGDVVDQFVAAEGLALAPNDSLPLEFSWRVPSYATSGSYRFATFVIVAERYNLLGLSFTDDVVGNTVPFEVIGETSNSVAIDKSSVTVDGRPYRFAAPPPRVAADTAVTITASLVNTSETAETATVVWDLYRWDAQRESNRITPALPSRTVKVPAKGALPISISVPPGVDPVVLVEASVYWRDTRSVVNVRLVRDGRDQPRLNFPSMTAFPLRRGEPVSLFTCLHNAGASPLIANARVELDLHDVDGTVIHKTSYVGPISSAMMAIADQFTPERSHGAVEMRARLYQDGQLADEATIVYRCTDIDPASCPTDDDVATPSAPSEKRGSSRALALLLIGLGSIAIAMWWRHHHKPRSGSPS